MWKKSGSEIKKIDTSEVFDSNGKTALKVSLYTQGGEEGCSLTVMNDTSIKDATEAIHEKIEKELLNDSVFQQALVDKKMITLDGTIEKSVLGKDVIFAISKAVCEAAAKTAPMPLYTYLGGISGRNIPTPILKLDDHKFLSVQDTYLFRDRLRKICQFYEDYQASKVMENVSPNIRIGTLQEITGAKDSVFVNPIQIGTVTETINYIKNSKMSGKVPILQLDEVETEDTFVADLAVALNVQYIDFGLPRGSQVNCKYNRIIEIEQQLM